MNHDQKVKHFCLIQLQILKERETRLRKDLLDCKIQKEFLESLINDLSLEND
jgi:hypothetical protein